jgi:branched-chain amino acid transport system substrate-binding protein
VKKVIIGIALLVIAAIVILNLVQDPWMLKRVQHDENSKPVVKIGFNIPLTGEFAMFGGIVKSSAEMAREDFSKRDLKYLYRFIFEDNALDAKRAIMVNQKLARADKVDAIIDLGSQIGLLTSKTAEENKIIHMSVSAIDARVADGEYSFVHWTQPESQVALMVHTLKEKGINRVAVFTSIDQDTVIMSGVLKKALAENNIAFAESLINLDERHFESIIDRAEAFNPQAYILLMYSPTLDLVMRRMKERGVKAEITAIESFNFLDDLSLAEGKWFVDAAGVRPEFRERFIKHNGSDNLFTAGNTYDAVMLLVEAFERAESKVDAASELRKIKNYHGVVGELTQNDKGVFNSKPALKRIKDGEIITD